jgi:signal transduction histidine kinase
VRREPDHLLIALALLAFVGATLEITFAHNPGNLPIGYVAVAIFCGALAIANRHPVTALVALAVTLVAHTLAGSHAVDSSGFLLIPFVGIIFTWALRVDSYAFLYQLVLIVAGTSAAILKDAPSQDQNGAANLFFVLLVFVGAPAVAGRVMRWRQETNDRLEQQAQELERNREARTRAARMATRASLARELHDIVAHEVSVMVVQAQAAARSVERGRGDAAGSIEAIEVTGREALTQMRRLLGVLRQEDEGAALAPQPSLRRHETLVVQARARGLDARLDAGGIDVALPSGVDLTAYRIAQEALQSVIEHGGATRADARFATRSGRLEMDLDANGQIAAATLAGMRERAAMYGGTIEVQPHGRGGTLRIRIPLNGVRAEVLA